MVRWFNVAAESHVVGSTHVIRGFRGSRVRPIWGKNRTKMFYLLIVYSLHYVIFSIPHRPWVTSGDSTADLDYTTPFALELPQNDTIGAPNKVSHILRSSTNPSQNASTIMPTNGQIGSLGDSGDVWIEVGRVR